MNESWRLWLYHLGSSITYRLESASARAAGETQAADLLAWEADRHADLATQHRTRAQRPARKAAVA